MSMDEKVSKSKKNEKIVYPIDKVNLYIWNSYDERMPEFQIVTAPKNSSKDSYIDLSLNFGEVYDGMYNLTAYDKRLYIAVAALYAPDTYITVRQIYNTMGYQGCPNSVNIKKINDALSKLQTVIVKIDNLAEVKNLKGYKYWNYDGALLPFRRISSVVNENNAIQLLEEPPLIKFARERKNVTTLQAEVLKSPLSKTQQTLELEDYLLLGIAMRARNKKFNKTMLIESILKKLNLTTPMQKARLLPKIRTLLKYYVTCGLIAGFEENERGFFLKFGKELEK